jgi:hypothetical protein
MTDVTKAAVSEGGRRSSSCEGSGAGWCQWEERVEITRAIVPGDHAPCLKVLRREAEWVKLDGTIIVIGETTNKN